MRLYKNLEGGVQIQPSDFEYQNNAVVDAISKMMSMYDVGDEGMLIISGLASSRDGYYDGVILYSGTIDGIAYKNVPVGVKGSAGFLVAGAKYVIVVEKIIADKRVYNAAGIKSQAPYSELKGRLIGVPESDHRIAVNSIKRLKQYYVDLLFKSFIPEKDRSVFVTQSKLAESLEKKHSTITMITKELTLEGDFGPVDSSLRVNPICFYEWGDVVQISGAFSYSGGNYDILGSELIDTKIDSPLPISDVYIPVNYYSDNKLIHILTLTLTVKGALKCVWVNADDYQFPNSNLILTPTTFIKKS